MAPTSKLTLGIELEFIVFYTTSDKLVPIEENDPYGPIPVVPRHITPPSDMEHLDNDIESLEAAYIRQQVADVIASTGCKSQARSNAKGSEPDIYKVWNVVPDLSVKLPLQIDNDYSPLKHVGIEVNSPAYVANEDAFQEISTVIKAIHSAFRTAVPPVCGLHVHVGRDGVPLKLRPLQRIASLLWLAEDLINTLHPGCRLGNPYCLDVRHCSNLAHGMSIVQATLHPRGLGEAQHAEFSVNRIDTHRTKPTDFPYCRPFGITVDEDSTPSRSLAADFNIELRDPEYESPEILDIMDGAQDILRATDTGAIAELFAWGVSTRGAYNLCNLEYEKDWRGLAIIGGEEVSSRKPTIEFRQAAGSLDDQWVILWAKICLALCGSAVVESSDDDFFQLLYDCAKGEEKPWTYDVFDLLHDIGLNEEDIEAVYNRLVTQRHELEPVLKFYHPDTCWHHATKDWEDLRAYYKVDEDFDRESTPDSWGDASW
ncbi:hypothetical protein HD806DRAFT_525879 [Xylariaceae sp. AK1471]|nr:hypothetical protein HD806DRAFT_525879 [Xylariaceae sp. AK1471]